MLKALAKADFFVHHCKGGHFHLRHDVKTSARVTVPFHTQFDLSPGVIRSILKQAELSKDELLELL